MNHNLQETSNGIRICVYKADRTKWTTVFASKAYLDKVLAICGNDIGAVTHQARYASLTCVQKAGETWTHAVLGGARRLLITEAKKLAVKRRQASAMLLSKVRRRHFLSLQLKITPPGSSFMLKQTGMLRVAARKFSVLPCHQRRTSACM